MLVFGGVPPILQEWRYLILSGLSFTTCCQYLGLTGWQLLNAIVVASYCYLCTDWWTGGPFYQTNCSNFVLYRSMFVTPKHSKITLARFRFLRPPQYCSIFLAFKKLSWINWTSFASSQCLPDPFSYTHLFFSCVICETKKSHQTRPWFPTVVTPVRVQVGTDVLGMKTTAKREGDELGISRLRLCERSFNG